MFNSYLVAKVKCGVSSHCDIKVFIHFLFNHWLCSYRFCNRWSLVQFSVLRGILCIHI